SIRTLRVRVPRTPTIRAPTTIRAPRVTTGNPTPTRTRTLLLRRLTEQHPAEHRHLLRQHLDPRNRPRHRTPQPLRAPPPSDHPPPHPRRPAPLAPHPRLKTHPSNPLIGRTGLSSRPPRSLRTPRSTPPPPRSRRVSAIQTNHPPTPATRRS